MFAIMNTTSVLFVTILLGLLSGMLGFFKRGDDRVLINYVFYIALPLNLFSSCFHASWAIFNGPYLLSYGLSMLFIIGVSYVLSRKYLGVSRRSSLVNTLSVSQVDGAYFTMPLFVIIFHSASLAVPLMLAQNVLFFTASLLFLEVSEEPDSKAHNVVVLFFLRIYHALSRNPIIIASLAGLLSAYLSLKLPTTVATSVNFIGSTSSAVALFSLGLTCAFFVKGLSDWRQLWPLLTLSFLKLLLFPLIAAGIGLLFKLPHDLLLALVLLTASPAATHTYIIANKYHCDAEVATFNVVLTTLFSFLTVNLWLYGFN